MYNSAENGEYDSAATYGAFSDKNIRQGFIRKVYGILSVQLVITFGFVALLSASEDSRKWTRSNMWLMWVALGVTLVLIIAMSCCENVRRKTPHNYICLMVFTVAEGFLVGMISSVYNYQVVITAVVITAVICLALTAFAFQTKIDFTIYSGLLFVVLIVFILFGLIASFFPGKTINLVYACIGALIFSAYLVIDTQMLVGGSHKYQISPEEYVFAALTLYLDIINIFMYMLQIIQSVSGDN